MSQFLSTSLASKLGRAWREALALLSASWTHPKTWGFSPPLIHITVHVKRRLLSRPNPKPFFKTGSWTCPNLLIKKSVSLWVPNLSSLFILCMLCLISVFAENCFITWGKTREDYFRSVSGIRRTTNGVRNANRMFLKTTVGNMNANKCIGTSNPVLRRNCRFPKGK